MKSKKIIELSIRKPKKIIKSFTIDPMVAQKFEKKCKKEGIALSAVVEILMEDFSTGS